MILSKQFQSGLSFLNLNNYPVIYQGKNFYLVGFGLFAALGTFLALGTFATYMYSKGIVFQTHVGVMMAVVVVSMMLFSKLLHPFVIGKKFFESPFKYLKQTAFYNQGGQFGVLFGIYVMSLIEPANFFILLDSVCYVYSLALVVGRLGCYNYGCCYGRPTQSWFSVTYTHPDSKVLRLHPELYNVPLIPTQLMSSAFDLILFITLTILYFYEPRDGVIAFVFIGAYNLFRVFIHHFRADDVQGNKHRDSPIFLWISVFLTTAGILGLLGIIVFYNDLPYTPTQVPLSFTLYFQQALLNLSNLIPALIVSIITFFVYGYHKRLGEHF